MGAGMATLQTAINPLLRVAGGEEHFAFNSAFAQLIFGTASFVSPRIYSYLVQNLSSVPSESNLLVRTLAKITPPAFPWASMYWIFAVFTIVMIVVLAATHFPKVQRTEEEAAGSVEIYRSLLRKPIVWMFFLSVFAYVGCEQGTADWISKFLSQYHGYDPHTAGAAAVSWFWGLLTAGCFIGMLLLKIFDSRHVLIGTAIGALVCLTAALFGPPNIAVLAFPAIGLFASVMWPILVSLGLNSVSEHHGPLAGILSTGIMGGAVVPVIIGRIGDHYGLRAGMAFLYVTFGCVFSVGFWAKPIITNATIGLKKAVVQPVV
jgi:fucose permease